ncbi:GTP-binding protein [Aquibacillus koreensis]|uniref:GTP-binding protein n=1 Tax=Aquibacillus koreensis TaxID=279446 RepID=UPI003899118F
MYKTIGLVAHVDAGKTTFSEQLLYHAKVIKERGRVDHKDTFLDDHTIEKERGITVFSGQATFTYNQSTYYVLDTPGHVDFSPEMERSIQVMDYAIIIISGVEGIEGHTETVWQLLRKHQVPTFFFINKTDRVGADVNRVMEEIRLHLSNKVMDLSGLSQEGEMGDSLIESLAERDEQLLEAYLTNGYDQQLWLQTLKNKIKKNELFPCGYGAAIQDEGIQEFFTVLDQLTESAYSDKDVFAGRVYKVRYEDNGNRVTFIKALRGKLSIREQVNYGNEAQRKLEKVTQMRVYNGHAYENVGYVEAGQLFAVTGLSLAQVGDGLGAISDKTTYDMIPTLKSKVIFDNGIHVKEVLQIFNILDAEDPSLHVEWDDYFQDIHIRVMGVIQLEVLAKIVMERFKIDVSFGEPKILYKETIEAPVNGYGHYEPLKHYAEVHLLIEPAERNSGLLFENKCHPNDLSIGQQNLVHQHLLERQHHGLLTGSPITDIKVTLLTGRAHNKHTSGGDFREATYRALRQGLEKVRNIVLEPFYAFKIKVETDHIGRVMSDIQQAHGTFESPEVIGNYSVITGRAPVATWMHYSTELASFTHGKGTIQLRFIGYEYCHNQEETIQLKSYDKDADPKYTSTSIFCSKGKGYKVPWYKAEEHMHCTINLTK